MESVGDYWSVSAGCVFVIVVLLSFNYSVIRLTFLLRGFRSYSPPVQNRREAHWKKVKKESYGSMRGCTRQQTGKMEGFSGFSRVFTLVPKSVQFGGYHILFFIFVHFSLPLPGSSITSTFPENKWAFSWNSENLFSPWLYSLKASRPFFVITSSSTWRDDGVEKKKAPRPFFFMMRIFLSKSLGFRNFMMQYFYYFCDILKGWNSHVCGRLNNNELTFDSESYKSILPTSNRETLSFALCIP